MSGRPWVPNMTEISTIAELQGVPGALEAAGCSTPPVPLIASGLLARGFTALRGVDLGL